MTTDRMTLDHVRFLRREGKYLEASNLLTAFYRKCAREKEFDKIELGVKEK